MKDKKIPVLVALREELPDDLPAQYVKVITGIGKINATIAIMKAIQEYQPTTVINYGTAGSLNPVFGSGIHKVAKVAQRDLDIRVLGLELGQASRSEPVWYILDDIETRPTLTSGDQFVNAVPEMMSDLVDMEAAAYAKVCKKYGIMLDVYKFVSDNADGEAAATWEENCHKGSKLFIQVLNDRDDPK
jgi:adenosylhomocysteine nucleosidase